MSLLLNPSLTDPSLSPSLPSSLLPDLSKPIDVYCEWIDECERISGEQEKVEGDEGEEEDV
jgi:hypothetical protein